MAEREAELVEVLLDRHSIDAGFAPAGQIGFVDPEDAIECAHVDHELARFGRTGVPLYVLYDSRGRPHLLPEILTEGAVLDALSDL